MNLGIESETLEFKKSTAEADRAMDNIASMLNKHGHGTVYFGVAPDGEVTGQQVSASSFDDVARKVKDAIRPVIYPEIKREILDGKAVIRVDFDGHEKPYSSHGRYYKRVFDRTEEMMPDELKRMMAETDSTSYWENHVTGFGMEAVDRGAVKTFYKKAVSCGRLERMAEYDPKDLLKSLGLLENGRLTNAGYYLFSDRKPVTLKLAVYVTDERISFSAIDRVEGNIFNLIGTGLSFIKEHIDWRVEYGGGTSRIEIPEVPVEAIREIVVNSFAHADFRGISENEIDITPTRIEIYNPGEFPYGLSPEMFVKQRIRSMPRNKVILNILYKSKDVEIFGSGFRKVYALCEKENIHTESDSGNGGFSFTFFRGAGATASGRVQEYDREQEYHGSVVKESEKPYGSNKDKKEEPGPLPAKVATDVAVYALLKEDPTQTREMLALRTGKTVRTIQRALDKLVSEGRIKRIGSSRSGNWEVM